MLRLFKLDSKIKKVERVDDGIVRLYAPVSGKAMPMDKSPDPMFSGKMLGDGFCVEPDDTTVVAPCDGEIMLFADTMHAVGIKAKNGAEVLIHIGVDTVNLGGQGFSRTLPEGVTEVKAGDPLVYFGRHLFLNKEIKMTTMVCITNGDGYKYNIVKCDGKVKANEDLMIEFEK